MSFVSQVTVLTRTSTDSPLYAESIIVNFSDSGNRSESIEDIKNNYFFICLALL